MTSCVYSATHRKTGVSYVGVTSQPLEVRWRQHVTLAARKPKGKLQREIRRSGASAFDVEVRAELLTYEEAQIAERILIALEQPVLNALSGGQGRVGGVGPVHTPESRARISAAHKGKSVSAETRAKLSANAKARPEQIARLIAGNVGRKQSAEAIAKQVAKNTGRKRSAETRAKISASMRGNSNRKKKENTTS